MRRVIIESPFAGATPELAERNLRYLQACIRDCAQKQESPYASHRMLPGALDDDDVNERALGIKLGFAWRRVAAATVVYHDLGFSHGMRLGIRHAQELIDDEDFMGDHEIVYRLLGGIWEMGLSQVGRP